MNLLLTYSAAEIERLGKNLGEGSFGEVILGRILDGDKLVALKANYGKKDFEDEMKNLTEVNKLGPHPNIVTIFGEWCDPEGNNIIVMDFAENGSLEKVSDIDVFQECMTALVRDALVGLVFLHKNLLMHGDIHGGNIIISKSDNGVFVAKLTDFGRTQVLGEPPFTFHPSLMSIEEIGDYSCYDDKWQYAQDCIQFADTGDKYLRLCFLWVKEGRKSFHIRPTAETLLTLMDEGKLDPYSFYT